MRFQLNEDITEAIKKNLPAEAGDLVRERLEECDRLEKDNGLKTARILMLETAMKTVEELEAEHGKVTDECNRLEVLESELTERARELDVAEKINAVRTEFTQAMLDHDKWVMQLVFGNRIIRSKVQSEVPVRFPGITVAGYEGGDTTQTPVDGGECLGPTETATETEEA